MQKKSKNKEKHQKISKKKLYRKQEGITLIALIITIIILLILASVTIPALSGDNGILTNASKAKFETEIREIEELILIKDLEGESSNKFGTINGLLNIDSEYNEKVMLENAKLVYDPDKVSKNEKKWLEEMGIYSKSNYYLIMMEDTKKEFSGQSNVGTMEEFRDLVNGNNFNYDTAYVIENINLNTDENNQWVPIGNKTTPFTKILDGSNYTISNLYIESEEDYQGLFGYNKGNIENVKLTRVNITSKKTGDVFVGGIVGYNDSGNIENCNIEDSQITAEGNDVAGITGCNYAGIVNNCINNSNITNTGNYATGGIVGWNYEKGKITNCENFGMIIGNRYIGGIIGTNENESSVENSCNKGSVESKSNYLNERNQIDSRVGGIVGFNRQQSYIKGCYNEGTIMGNGFGIGGIVGSCSYYQDKYSTVENCYNTGEVLDKGKEGQVGGICGTAQYSKIKKCYNAGNITGTGAIGGIIGHLGYEDITYVENCYNSGIITGTTGNYIGGIAGVAYNGEIKNSYNVGDIKSDSNYQGGITSYYNSITYYKVSNCYYLNTTNEGGINKVDVAGEAEGRTITEMKSQEFISLLNTDDEEIWLQDNNNINKGYPILNWQ